MKRITNPAAFAMLTLCLFSFLFFSNRNDPERSSSCRMIATKEKKTYTYQAEKKELRPFENITADLNEMDLKIKPSADHKYYISYKIYCYNSEDPFICQVEDNTLQMMALG